MSDEVGNAIRAALIRKISESHGRCDFPSEDTIIELPEFFADLDGSIRENWNEDRLAEKVQNELAELLQEGLISGAKFDRFHGTGSYRMTRLGWEMKLPWHSRAWKNIKGNLPSIALAIITSLAMPLAVNWLTKMMGWN